MLRIKGYTVENHGSIYLIRPDDEEYRAALAEVVDAEGWQWFGDALAVEPRYAPGLVELLLVNRQ